MDTTPNLPSDVLLPILELIDRSTPFKISKSVSHALYEREVSRAYTSFSSKRRTIKSLLRKGNPDLARYLRFVDMADNNSRLYLLACCFKYPSQLSMRIVTENYGKMEADSSILIKDITQIGKPVAPVRVRNIRRLLTSSLGQKMLAFAVNVLENGERLMNKILDGRMLRITDKDKYLHFLEALEERRIDQLLSTVNVSYKRFSFLDTHSAFFSRAICLLRFTRIFFRWFRAYPSFYAGGALATASSDEYYLALLSLQDDPVHHRYQNQLWLYYVELDNPNLDEQALQHIDHHSRPAASYYRQEFWPSRLKTGWWKDPARKHIVLKWLSEWTASSPSYLRRRPELTRFLLEQGILEQKPVPQRFRLLSAYHKRMDILEEARKQEFVDWIMTSESFHFQSLGWARAIGKYISTMEQMAPTWLSALVMGWTRDVRLDRAPCGAHGESTSNPKKERLLELSFLLFPTLRRLYDMGDYTFPLESILDEKLVKQKDFERLLKAHYSRIIPSLSWRIVDTIIVDVLMKPDIETATLYRDCLTSSQWRQMLIRHSNIRDYTKTLVESSQTVLNFLFDAGPRFAFDFTDYINSIQTRGLAIISSEYFWDMVIKQLYTGSYSMCSNVLQMLSNGFTNQTLEQFYRRLRAHPEYEHRKAYVDENMRMLCSEVYGYYQKSNDSYFLANWMFPVFLCEEAPVYALLGKLLCSDFAIHVTYLKMARGLSYDKTSREVIDMVQTKVADIRNNNSTTSDERNNHSL